MNPKLQLLRLFFNIDTWRSYRQYISIKDDKYLFQLYEALDLFLTSVDRNVSLDEFKAFLGTFKGLLDGKDKDVYTHLLAELEGNTLNEDVLQLLLTRIKQQEIAEKLGIVSFEFSEGKKTFEELVSVYESFDKVETVETSDYVTDNLDELYEHTIGKRGLRWRLGSLNRTLGSLRKGDFGFLFARPETGKTTFLASEVSNFAEQTETPIIWINNEEQGSKVMSRIMQASLGLTINQLMGDRHENQRRYYERTKGNIRVRDDATIHKREIENLCHKSSPSLVVIDQIDKVKGFTGDREDIKLGNIYQWARELAKEYCPIIGVCQADGTAEGVKWLNMGHVTSAKTSKQAEADFILGIGKSNEAGLENTRYISICKNKLQGDEDTDPTRRHGYSEVVIQPEIARYRDVGT